MNEEAIKTVSSLMALKEMLSAYLPSFDFDKVMQDFADMICEKQRENCAKNLLIVYVDGMLDVHEIYRTIDSANPPTIEEVFNGVINHK